MSSDTESRTPPPGPFRQKTPEETFAGHEIARIDERSLLLENPQSSNLWCTIAIDDMGQIVVFGDFGPMVFAHSRGSLRDRIAWIGSHVECDGHIVGKANLGMQNVGRGMTIATLEDFEADVRQSFGYRRREDDYDEETLNALTWDVFSEECWIHEGDVDPSAAPAQRKLVEYLGTIDMDQDAWEWVAGLGERPIRDVTLAHAALRRAHLILEAGSSG